MCSNFQISTTKDSFDSWLEYIKECGYTVTMKREGVGFTYYSYDCPNYGKLTPVAFKYLDELKNRWKRLIFIRLPDENLRMILGKDGIKEIVGNNCNLIGKNLAEKI